MLVKFDLDMIEWIDGEAKRRRVPRVQILRDLVLREMNTVTPTKDPT